MRSGSVDTYLNRQAYCLLHFEAYTVDHPSTGRQFTRNTVKDIPEKFVDPSSIRFEAAMSSSGFYEPGGVIPATIRCHVFGIIEDDGEIYEYGTRGGTIRWYSATPVPESTSDYNLAYLPVITMYAGSYQVSTNLTSHMIITQAEKRDDYGFDLTFQTELCVLDGMEYDLSTQDNNPFSVVAQNAFLFAGFPGNAFTNENFCYQGRCENATGTSTARQTLSHIMEISGCYIKQRDGTFRPVPVMSVVEDEDGFPKPQWTISDDWVLDYIHVSTFGRGADIINSVEILTDQDSKPKNKNIHRYVCSGNPFVKSGNKSAIRTLVHDRICSMADNPGIEVTCLFNPLLEPGDFIKYKLSVFILTRIEWDGGAFCKLYGAKPNKGYVR